MAGKGVWIDTKTGKVVEGKQPAEGVQLVSPNAEPTDQDRDYVEQVKANLAEAEGESSAAKTVTTKGTGTK